MTDQGGEQSMRETRCRIYQSPNDWLRRRTLMRETTCHILSKPKWRTFNKKQDTISYQSQMRCIPRRWSHCKVGMMRTRCWKGSEESGEESSKESFMTIGSSDISNTHPYGSLKSPADEMKYRAKWRMRQQALNDKTECHSIGAQTQSQITDQTTDFQRQDKMTYYSPNDELVNEHSMTKEDDISWPKWRKRQRTLNVPSVYSASSTSSPSSRRERPWMATSSSPIGEPGATALPKMAATPRVAEERFRPYVFGGGMVRVGAEADLFNWLAYSLCIFKINECSLDLRTTERLG